MTDQTLEEVPDPIAPEVRDRDRRVMENVEDYIKEEMQPLLEALEPTMMNQRNVSPDAPVSFVMQSESISAVVGANVKLKIDVHIQEM